MRKSFAILAAAAAALTSTIGMAQTAERTFQYEGQTYVYMTQKLKDRQVISGRRFPAGTPFRLVVRNGYVSGRAGGVPVSFRAADAKGAVEHVQLASR